MDTPELDKQNAIIETGAPAAVQEFYDWLQQQGLRLCRWVENCTETRPCEGDAGGSGYGCINGRRAYKGEQIAGLCPVCRGSGERVVSIADRWVEDYRTPEQLMADHFGIDRNKIDAERRAILASFRSAKPGEG